MAVGVVDRLEAVEIKQDHRPGAFVIQRFVDNVEDSPAVQEICERIAIDQSGVGTDAVAVAEQHAEQTAHCAEQPDLVSREQPGIAILQADQTDGEVVGRDPR